MKSHFMFTRGQRNGILFLVFIVVVFQCIYFFVHIPSPDFQQDQQIIQKLDKKIDSLKKEQIEKNKPKIYPFNPNYISDYKGYTLGMSSEEINRLFAFREKDKWVNSAQEFQQVTKVSDSLLKEISPYFKFPEWINKPSKSYTSNYSEKKPKTFEQKIDLNLATAQQLTQVNGIGKALSKRIIKYRNKFKGGFLSDIELDYIYGLSPEVIKRVKNDFTVKTPRLIKVIKLNSATIEDLVTIPYIDYEIAYQIKEQRTLRDRFNNFKELTKVKDFPVDKLEIIKLYLSLN